MPDVRTQQARERADVQADINVVLDTLLKADEIIEWYRRQTGGTRALAVLHAIDALDALVRERNEARSEIERLREALNQHRPPSCPCRACEAVKLAAAQEPPASTSTDVKDGRCQKCGGFPLLDECGCLSGPWQEPPAKGGDRDE